MDPRMVDGLLRFIRLENQDKKLLCCSYAMVAAVRLALWLLPFRTARALLDRIPRKREDQAIAPERLSWAVRVSSRRVLGASCLTQALALLVLLSRQGQVAQLRFGVCQDRTEGFRAHAWLMLRGKILIGEELLDQYTPIRMLGSEVP